jgi:hypothetical protein
MKIIGLDVGGAYSTAFLLDTLPANLKEFSQSTEFTPFRVNHTAEDLNGLIELKADWIIFEPTGFHYERLLINWCDRHGQPWRQVIGTRMAAHRKGLGLPKTDGRDALAIAHYGMTYINDPHAFVQPCQLTELRRIWIERDTLVRIRGSLINRLRQQLKHEFPEVADKDLDRKWRDPSPALIRWMVDDPTLTPVFASRYRNMHYAGRWKTPSNGAYKETVGTIGSGLGDHSRMLAKQIFDIDSANIEKEITIERWLAEPRFEKYVAAFEQLKFSSNLQAIWLTRIYPIDRFLDENGRPIKNKRPSKNGKLVTHYVSLSRFKAALGAGTEPNTSGIRGEVTTKYYKRRRPGEIEKIPMGDKLCRKAFALWGMRLVECGKLNRSTPAADALMRKHEQLKAKGTKKMQRLMNLHGYAARLLFQLLTTES